MAEAVVSIVLQSLRDLLVEKARFLSGVTDQVEEISTELKRMQCFLKDADTRLQHKDETIQNWLREIRQLAYQVEDIVETFAVEVASNKERGMKKVLTRFSCIFCEGKSLHNLGMEIAKFKTDIGNLTTSLQRYDIKAIGAREEGYSNENPRWERQTYGHEVEEHFVGMEEDVKKLVLLMLDNDKHHRVISIWGMGGLGKTTLARKVYKHKDVQRCFERFAWACVTQQGNIRSILQDILMQLHPEKIGDMKSMGDRELVQQLHQVQKERKCLVVLDDIWRVDDWKSLVAAFPVAEGDGKILLTTRKRMMAEIGFAYAPKCLTEQESWELLQRIAFSRISTEDFNIKRKLEAVGIEMVRKCGGLPLAISVLGGILKDKDSLTDWQMVNKYISSYLSKVENDEEGLGAVARVLSLSYNDLPYHLKPCFLYLGSFQEDEDIHAEQLYLLWMAEGMVLSQHQRSEETLIEVAERYLDELWRRSMVQVKVHEYVKSRRFLSCRLHDMMRDLCLEKGKEEEFIKVIDFRGVKQPFLDSSAYSNIPSRLVIHMDDEVKCATKECYPQEICQQLRSLLCLNASSKLLAKQIIWPQEIFNLGHSKSLRALQFEGYDFRERNFPVELQKLIHLRLLNLNNCKLDELPSSIAGLPFLNTLIINVNNKIKVPNVFGKMKQLRHLYLVSDGRFTERGKLRLHGLSQLETLFGVDSTTDEISDLTSLRNLRFLFGKTTDNNSLHMVIDHISTNGLKLQEIALQIDACDFVSSEERSVLLSKVLMCRNLHHLGLTVKLSKLPAYEPYFLQNLVELGLEGNKIEEDPMKTLEKLPQLRHLTLGCDAYIGKNMVCHEWGFPQLRDLYLIKLPNLEHWRVDKGGMPKTSTLIIWACRKLEMIPDGLKFVLNLEKGIIFEMPDKFCNRIKDIDGRKGDDFDKIQHVPSICVDHPFELVELRLNQIRKWTLEAWPDAKQG